MGVLLDSRQRVLSRKFERRLANIVPMTSYRLTSHPKQKKAYSEGLHSGELQCGCWVRKIFSTNEDAKLGNRDFFRTWLDWKNFMINISRPIENIFSEKIFFWNVHWIRKSSKSHLWMSKKEKKLVNYLISTSIHSRM